MRFVFVSSMRWYPWGGSEELWGQAAVRLRARGHHVAAAVCWQPQLSKRVDEMAKKGVEIFVQSPPFASLPLRAWRRLATKITRQSNRELRWLIDQKPDLVCVSNGCNVDGLSFLEMCHRESLPYVSVIQANSEHLWPNDADAEKLVAVYRGSRKAFFVSHMNRRLFESQLGIKLSNAEVVWNPTNVRRDASPSWPSESAGWKFACVARLEPNAKGQDLLIQVLSTDTWKARPFTLSLIGAGPMEKGLRRLATTLGIDQRIRVVGHVSDIEKVWTEHHALLLTSRYEGLPLVLVEAMLCSRPAIITEVAGDGQMVEEGVTGFVAPAPTVQFVAQAMERAWERRADWQQMGKAARQRVERLVPADPIDHFCQRLIHCVSS